MTSAALRNLMKALEYISGLDKYPLYADMSEFCNPGGFEALDRARETFYRDEVSRKIFDWFCRYRIIMEAYGSSFPVELEDAPISKRTWADLKARAKAMPDQDHVAGDYLLDRIDVWLLEAYAHPPFCVAGEGDIVLDCGAFTGNSSLYFSRKVGPGGRVYGFEPVPEIYERYAANMRGLDNVVPVNGAVNDREGVISFSESGAASREKKDGRLKVYGLSIDGFFEKQGLERVDFIKMDVEGAEERALRGAREVIRKCRPRMAISVYHNEYDILTIPTLIRTVCADYLFALGHFSTNHNETVLYCYFE